MNCQNCNKQEATVHLQEVIDGQVKAVHLCAACAAENGLDVDEAGAVALAELLFNLKAVPHEKKAEVPGGDATDSEEPEPIRCPHCGTSETDIGSTGRLGCPDCYNAFGSFLGERLPRMHRGQVHTGRSPGGKPCQVGEQLSGRLGGLREELARAVASEAYERAAEIRDEIERLQASGQKVGRT